MYGTHSHCRRWAHVHAVSAPFWLVFAMLEVVFTLRLCLVFTLLVCCAEGVRESGKLCQDKVRRCPSDKFCCNCRWEITLHSGFDQDIAGKFTTAGQYRPASDCDCCAR
eukprot:TRINITY_DN20872_c0_g1_i1.p2 TRINITY_DN20872_c0_g1~~TRINITY_DN20872_c0_g1_i1.p2  ORF type:complete len:109 (-),score=14.38 TRINITY_DN20872_c0_g1_i1:413-739(-)